MMDNEKEIVSIHCMTYNHVNYIRDCLEGIVKQKTNFQFIAYVGDDCSTDGTTEIVKEYENKYPDIIKGIYHKNNTKAEGNFFDILWSCKGKYLIFCEGDDYWADENKLQKQIDFMEQNPDYTICFHPVLKIVENRKEKGEIFPTETMVKNGFSFENLLKYNFMQTNSVLYRLEAVSNLVQKFPKNMMPGDWYLHLLFAKQGKIKYFNEIMSIYRVHRSGAWGNLKHDERLCKYNVKYLNFYINVYNNVTDKNFKYKRIVMLQYRKLIKALMDNNEYVKMVILLAHHPILFIQLLYSLIIFFYKYLFIAF